MGSLMKIWISRKLQVRQRGILAVQRNIPRKNFLQERKLFLTYGLWTRTYSVSGNRNWQSCQNCIPCDQKNTWIKKNFISKISKLDSFSWVLAKKCRNLGKNNRQGFQVRKLRIRENFNRKSGRTRKAIYVSSGAVRGKNFGRKQNFLTFGE